MDIVLAEIEYDNNQLHDSLKEKEDETHILLEKIRMLENAIEKEKKFHRKYADEVTATETIRIADFKKEKQTYKEEIKTLTKTNRQLVKDVEFYKKLHEELVRNESFEREAGNNSLVKAPAQTYESESQTVPSHKRPNVSKQRSTKEVSKINLSLFNENKKLQSKVQDLNTTVAVWKKKNKQLENFRNKIETKKSKFCKDAEELERLVNASKTKNKDKYTVNVLDMLGDLAKNKKV